MDTLNILNEYPQYVELLCRILKSKSLSIRQYNFFIRYPHISIYKISFSLLIICFQPVNVILQGTSTPFPFHLFTVFPFISTVSILPKSALRKKTQFLQVSHFSFSLSAQHILLEKRNKQCRSLKQIVYKMFHTYRTPQPNKRKIQKLFQILQELESLKNLKVPSFTKYIQFLVFAFKTVKKRSPCRKRKKELPIKINSRRYKK